MWWKIRSVNSQILRAQGELRMWINGQTDVKKIGNFFFPNKLANEEVKENHICHLAITRDWIGFNSNSNISNQFEIWLTWREREENKGRKGKRWSCGSNVLNLMKIEIIIYNYKIIQSKPANSILKEKKMLNHFLFALRTIEKFRKRVYVWYICIGTLATCAFEHWWN